MANFLLLQQQRLHLHGAALALVEMSRLQEGRFLGTHRILPQPRLLRRPHLDLLPLLVLRGPQLDLRLLLVLRRPLVGLQAGSGRRREQDSEVEYVIKLV